METVVRDNGVGHPPENFDCADVARSEHGALACREYNLLASEASERGPASAGPAAGEDGHGATNHSKGRLWENEVDENPKRALRRRKPMEERRRIGAPPNGRARLT